MSETDHLLEIVNLAVDTKAHRCNEKADGQDSKQRIGLTCKTKYTLDLQL